MTKLLCAAVFLFAAALPAFAQNVFLELNLDNRSPQTAFRPAGGTHLDILRVIERAGADARVDGIVLNLSAFSAGHEIKWELRQALEEFRDTGKKIVAFISTANLNMYYLASVADKIVMDDQGTLMLLGYVWGRGYARNALDRLGVGVRELRYFEYKSAAETFTRAYLSEADRRQYGEWLDDVMAVTRTAITESRSMTTEEFYSIINTEFLFSARAALERGLVDATGRRSAVVDAVREVSGRELTGFVIFGETGTGITGATQIYPPGGGGGQRRRPVIAVINAVGATDMDRGMSARTLARTIDDVSRQRRVRAIVLRINSPGGSAEAADHIAEAVRSARTRVPVVVSMGGVAASGGYWAAMNADHITASPVTVTGSIGVIGTWFYDRGLNERLGITVDTIQRGNHADLMSGVILPHRDLNEAEQERFRRYIVDHYDAFVARVAESRGMELEQAHAVAQGRIFSGIGALDSGLIDSIGGLAHAVAVARELAGIPQNQPVAFEQLPRPRFFDRLVASLSRMAVRHRAGITAPVTEAAMFMSDIFLPVWLAEDLRLRIANNGRVMPLLPMDGWQ